MPFTIIDGGSFVSTGAGVKINLPASCDYFKTTNVTKMGVTTAACVAGEWFGPKFGFGQSAANDGLRWRKAGSHSILIDYFSTATASNGFTYVTTSPVVEAQAPNAITAITNASPAVVSQVNTYADGDIIRIYNVTNMQQIAGMDFQISTVTGAGYTLIGLRAAGFLAAATGGFTRRISKYNAVEPEFMYITEITKASSAVVRTSIDPTLYYVVGMKVRFSITAGFGMPEMNGLTGTITAMSSADYTMTVNIDSTAFTTFAFPPSTPVNSKKFSTLAPAGASTQYDPIAHTYTGYNFDLQPFHTGQFTPYMYLGGASAASVVGESGDNINWMAYKLEA